MAQFHTADWWSKEIGRMLQDQTPEDLHLDYKEQRSLLPPGRGGSSGIDKQKRAEDISKDVSAFLNSDGGVLVYGVPESISPDDTGGSPIPGGAQVGFTRGEIDKETIENLITSNIQPKPSPDLFQVVEVSHGSDDWLVFIVEVAAGFGDVWQAKDKRYYRRAQFKSEPMEHYEINMVRDRQFGPDLKLVFGFNDQWETNITETDCYRYEGAEIRIHVGVQNAANTPAESALIELGLYPDDPRARSEMRRGEIPDGLLPEPFERVGLRTVRSGDPRDWLVVWNQLCWNGSNTRLAGRYGPIFRTEAPLPVAEIPMVGVPVKVYHRPTHFAFLCWRLQAPGMEPRKGVVRLIAGDNRVFSTPLLDCDDYEWEMV